MVERLSEKAIEIVNELHTERLDYTSEYLPLMEFYEKAVDYDDFPWSYKSPVKEMKGGNQNE